MLDMLVYFVGFCTLSAIAVFLVFLSIRFEIEKNGYVLFTFLGFGLIYTYANSNHREKLNELRKSQNQKIFINAPVWFNKHVWNFGVKK